MTNSSFHIPSSWSSLTWQQLCICWQSKIRYGGSPDAARAAALLGLCGCTVCSAKKAEPLAYSDKTGESRFILRDSAGRHYTVTPRELAWMAKQSMMWFDFPYGDQGEAEERDENGKVVKESREAVIGYVSQMHDAMILPVEHITIRGSRFAVPGEKRPWWKSSFTFTLSLFTSSKTFAMPQVACNSLTWQQYRSLQGITSQLFQDGIDDEQALSLQAQFLAHCLVPRSIALFDTTGGAIRLRPHYDYHYSAEQAEELERWWEKRLRRDIKQTSRHTDIEKAVSTIYHICFQTYQTALRYYESVYPLLFQDSGKQDPLRDALTGEVGTINTVMKCAGYSEQQQVYDSNLPFVLDILNTMTKEAKEIEKINRKNKK